MKNLPIMLLGISLLLGGCDFYREREETLERVKSVDEKRLELLYHQLMDLYKNSEQHMYMREWYKDGIPKEFSDLRPRKISMRPGHIYFSFWFCMDEGIQYDVFGFDGKRDPEIILSWGEPGRSDYHEVTVWKSKR